MTEIRFYHMQRARLEGVLPQILAKAYERGMRAVVRFETDERLKQMDGLLWSANRDGFLPHGSARDGHASEQPIWLTLVDENPNNADLLVLTEGTDSASCGDYDMVCELFDGANVEAVATARARWKEYKEAGHDVTYWQQDSRGRWEQIHKMIKKS
ncbi:MAG: DNA polymerase III subunit chi [Pseudomonadota bacterium]|nr:DNA polymerase III subunit chi [Pseudomonadota bacterium]